MKEKNENTKEKLTWKKIICLGNKRQTRLMKKKVQM